MLMTKYKQALVRPLIANQETFQQKLPPPPHGQVSKYSASPNDSGAKHANLQKSFPATLLFATRNPRRTRQGYKSIR
jgi:hypothetical protein